MSTPDIYVEEHLDGRRYMRFIVDLEIEVTDAIGLAADALGPDETDGIRRSLEAETRDALARAIVDGIQAAPGIRYAGGSGPMLRLPDESGALYREYVVGPVPIRGND